MDQFVVEGPCRLQGEVTVPGAKNSISKLITASMLTDKPCEYSNVPAIADTADTLDICRALGTQFDTTEARLLQVRTKSVTNSEVPAEMALKNRLSVMMLAPLLHRTGEAIIHAAGGDRIGVRPVDFHLEAYRRMGADVQVVDDVYHVRSQRLRGAEITLPYPSVSATENILLAAVLAEGRTYIRNAAIEPEIIDLALYLQKMGAIIDQQVDRTYVIEGVQTLTGATHEIIPDRFVSASLGAAALLTEGDVFVRQARQRDMLTFLNTIRRIGGSFEIESDGIRFFRNGPLRALSMETSVHPGFMTDWQPPFVVLLTQAEGMSVIHETVFENRFGYVNQLREMGADIEVYDACLGGSGCRFAARGHRHSAVVRGPTPLKGSNLEVPDLRAGFTQLIAATAAQGKSVLMGVEHIDRGYEHIDDTLRHLGASIERQSRD
ncbi:MAG: UDP-N-acetylglucosamine 1-carboxyvinyltransferase [Gemmatimonadota bacterium]|nr:UDP-N-acetylglucosamine 1-carboxyvinyltransferase [Gemmatimonadota bacterium]